MEHPVRVAFCKILFWKNGGSFDVNGLPFKEWSLDQKKQYVRSKCSTPFDCGQCPLLHEWLSYLHSQGWTWGWECDQCLKDTLKADQDAGVERSVQGYYQAGRKAGTTEEDIWNFDSDKPALEGCTRCGWESSFLQLVLRR